MIISYYIKSESGDGGLNVGEWSSAKDFKEYLVGNIECYYPVGEYDFKTLGATKEQDAEIKKVMKEFYDYSWSYGE